MNIFETLRKIQVELKAPKDMHNDFGNYTYRSAESIYESAKPLCAKYRCTLVVSDELLLIGNRYYVKATATIRDDEGNAASTSAFAREEETRRGMDGAQITGTASSYARKYALNGLFCIDDAKDADTNEYRGENRKDANAPKQVSTDEIEKAKKNAKHAYLEALKTYCKITGKLPNDVGALVSENVVGKQSKDYDIADWNSALNAVNSWIAQVKSA